MVQQPVDSLVGTNGHMLRTIMSNPAFHTLHLQEGVETWQALFDLALELPLVRAVIDSGALAVGASNLEVARFILRRMDPDLFFGVLFFDVIGGGWAVLDPHGCVQSKGSVE